MICSSFLDSNFAWINRSGSAAADEVSKVCSADEVTIRPEAKKDFWSQTFYSPPLVKADACGYLFHVPTDGEVTIKVDFVYSAVEQFDQAGLLIYIDDETWVKCGIEYCDGEPRLSVVVTNNGFSDWSTQAWVADAGTGRLGARLKVHRISQGNSLVVEAAVLQSDHYFFVRIAHLAPRLAESPASWRIGPFAACPVAQSGCSASFTNFSVTARETTAHDPNLLL